MVGLITVIATVAVAGHPVALEPVTEYTVEAVTVSTIDVVVAEVFHVTEGALPTAVKVVVPLVQK